MILSPCCGAACYIENDAAPIGPARLSHWYVCAECGLPCDPQPERDGDALDDSCKDTRAKGGKK